MTAADGPAALPRAPDRRIERIDALRGLALLGIAQINIQSFTWGAGEPLGYLRAPAQAGETLLYFLQAAFIQGKFYPIFGFLFGVGMALQWRKLRRRHASDRAAARAAYRRRLRILLLLGIAHGFLLFCGDVLAAYAVCGLGLFTLAPARPRRLLTLCRWTWFAAALSLLVPIVLLAGAGPPDAPGQIPAATAYAHAVYTEAGFVGQLGQRAFDEQWQQIGGIPTFWPQVIALFSLGLLAGRLGWLQHPQRHARVWRRAAQLGLLVGLPCSLLGAALTVARLRLAPGTDSAWDGVLLDIGSLQAAAYVAGAIRAFDRPRGQRVVGWLAAAGRLSLTHYLGQSLVMGALLSGWGLGLGARAGRAELALLALAIFLAQVALSRLVLRWFRQGPVEAVWRWATYGGDAAGR